MANIPAKLGNKALLIDGKDTLSPWLDSVKAVTGIDPRKQQPSSTIYLLLDISYSMEGPYIAEALEGARKFDAECRASQQAIGLICFGSSAQKIAAPSRSGIAAFLKNIQCNGSTNMADALELATTDLVSVYRQRTILIVTDGCPDDPEATLKAANRAKQAGIRILTIGTTGSDTNFLAKLASSEAFAVITSSGTLGKALSNTAGRLLLK